MTGDAGLDAPSVPVAGPGSGVHPATRPAAARAALVARFWDRRTGLFRTRAGWPARARWWLPAGRWHYWWQAHALQVLLDGVEAGDAGAGGLVGQHLAGITARCGGDATHNDFIDDLSWLGLAALRAHRLGLVDAELPCRLAAAVRCGHDPDLGGFRWRRGDDLHNVAASAPAAMLLAGCAELASRPEWLDLARDTAQWLHRTVVEDPGVVWDGARARGKRLVPEGRLWSYNVGTVAGLDVTLAASADPQEADRLLARAGRVLRAGTTALRAGCGEVGAARAAVAAPLRGGGTSRSAQTAPWRDELGDGTGRDPQLFRGILAQHAARLVAADPTRTPDIAADLARQGEAAWAARDRHGLIGPRWADPRPPPGSPHAGPPWLAAHLSGTLVLAAAARVAAGT